MSTFVRPINLWKIPNVYRLSLVRGYIGRRLKSSPSPAIRRTDNPGTNNFILIFIFLGKVSKDGSTSDPNKTTNPASSPSKWPGVRLLLSLLATENKDNSTKLRILLGEACVAVYLSLLALAWSNSQPNQLYRLVVNSLKAGMWGMVFGGGLRSALQQSGGRCN